MHDASRSRGSSPRSLPAAACSLVAQADRRPRSRSTATPICCSTPLDTFVGEVGGVGPNSKGQIFVYTRTGHPYATLGDNRTFYRNGSRLFQFDPTGKFVRELGQDVYGFNAAIGLRIDPQDNVWTIDRGASQVVKFDSEGRVALVLGRKPEAIGVRPAAPAAGGGPKALRAPAAGRRSAAAPAGGGAPARRRRAPGLDVQSAHRRGLGQGRQHLHRRRHGRQRNRMAKFDKDGSFITQWGSTGTDARPVPRPQGASPSTRPATSTSPTPATSASRCSTATAPSSREFGNIGTPLAMCMTTRRRRSISTSRTPGDSDGMDDAAIYKVHARRQGGRQVRQRPASCRRSSASPTPSTAATRTSCWSAR